MQLTQPLTARAAGYCTARPGLRFTAAEAAAALDATEDTTTAILDMLVGRGVNGALTRDGEGYVFTDDPAKGITASCSPVQPAGRLARRPRHRARPAALPDLRPRPADQPVGRPLPGQRAG